MSHGRIFWTFPSNTDEALPPLTDESQPNDIDFRLLATHLPTLCWIARADGYIIWYNQRWHDYCGTTPDQMAGWGWQSVHDPERLPEVLSRWASSIASGQPFEMVFPLLGADGHFRPFLTRIIPLRDASGDVVRWFGVNTEIGAQINAEEQRDATEARYHVLTEAMPQMVWSTLPDGYHDYFNERWYDFTGVPRGSTDGEAWNGIFHPDDQERAFARWRHSLDTGESYGIEYRLRHHSGDYRWVLGRAMPVRNVKGEIIRWIGTCTDIHDAKSAAEQNEILSRELSHRIKNIFAVISGLIGLSARQVPEAAGYARDLSARVIALGRAHEFARPHSDNSRPSFGDATLANVLRAILEPYERADAPRIAVTGDDVPLDDQAATPIALLFHELATNAAKYGALSVAEGSVTIDIAKRADHIAIDWREHGGPAVSGAPQSTGFGTRLTDLSVRQQLGGAITRSWESDGLALHVDLPLSRLQRR